MEKFVLKGGPDYLSLTIDKVYGFPDETSFKGGYEIRATVEVKSRSFSAISQFYSSTGELYSFYKQLKECNKMVSGAAEYVLYEGNFELRADYDQLGHVTISGALTEHNEWDNELKFEFSTDQSYIRTTLTELDAIVAKYGGLKGVTT